MTALARLLAIGAMAWLVSMAAGGDAKDDGHGYEDTPFLPNSQWRVHDRHRPQPPLVEPGQTPGQMLGAPPADALVLFDGKDLSQWEGGKPEGVEDGCINIHKTGQISTKKEFGDCQLHVEWATPAKDDGGWMNWGNSGVLFHGKYELQIIESNAHQIYADGIAGAVYGQTPPLVNASRKPGQWQVYDIVFMAPRFNGDKLLTPAYFTVFWNGILVQNHTAVLGTTGHRILPVYDWRRSTGPIVLQHHHSAVRFRNIWVRELKSGPPAVQ
jgi:hypothetical protein